MNVVSNLRASRPIFDSRHGPYFSCPVQREPEALSVRISGQGAKLAIYFQLGPLSKQPKAIYTPAFTPTYDFVLRAQLSA